MAPWANLAQYASGSGAYRQISSAYVPANIFAYSYTPSSCSDLKSGPHAPFVPQYNPSGHLNPSPASDTTGDELCRVAYTLSYQRTGRTSVGRPALLFQARPYPAPSRDRPAATTYPQTCPLFPVHRWEAAAARTRSTTREGYRRLRTGASHGCRWPLGISARRPGRGRRDRHMGCPCPRTRSGQRPAPARTTFRSTRRRCSIAGCRPPVHTYQIALAPAESDVSCLDTTTYAALSKKGPQRGGSTALSVPNAPLTVTTSIAMIRPPGTIFAE